MAVSIMLELLRIAALFTLCLTLAPGMLSPVRADDLIPSNPTPVVTIHSSGGRVTVNGSAAVAGLQLQPGLANVRLSHFALDQTTRSRIMVPATRTRLFGRHGWRMFQLPPRQFFVPHLNDNNDGIAFENPGGDINLGVPRRVGVLFINADGGDVVLNRVRGPYVITGNPASVRLQNVVGHGFIRTTSGNIILVGIGGDVHIQTATGRIIARGSAVETADVVCQSGSIDWRFARLGAGSYRFRSGDAPIRLSFRPGVAALVDFQSDRGSVQNNLDAGIAQARFVSAHAMSIAINGGGPEVTAASAGGDVTITP
ncbi:MAG: DUF4097 domain-containing protein [Candidatus Eremiobacteraeota bacterium]|nr:DUF4097 domain-containing protein [Candidatus Eremiobacteraeota bacterium]